ncbi:MAG TPA: CapA family protein [Candidatus Limnocylindrales bacterium]|nr:CapA family protein [Candidatus Limnocylindrales bacterium]
MTMRNPRLPVRRGGLPRRDPRYASGARGSGGPRLDARSGLLLAGLFVLLVGAPLYVLGAFGGRGTPPLAGSPTPAGSLGPSAAPSSPPASPAAPAVGRMPIVPVVRFWSTKRSASQAELATALSGEDARWKSIVVPTGMRDTIGRLLGVAPGPGVLEGDPKAIRQAVKTGGLGFMRAADVTPAVRALAVDRVELFGNDRVEALDAWPLVVETTHGAGYDPGRAFTIMAAGDILLDRGVARQVTVLGKGVDFPFDGGTAEITGFTCCSGFGRRVPVTKRTGNEGAVRRLLSEADLALANLENATPKRWRYHTSGLVFTGDPRLLDGVRKAGFDYLSLANNHSGNGGRQGLIETIRAVRERGFATSGAGRRLAEARAPAILETHGLRIAVLACDGIAPAYWARDDRIGVAPCDSDNLVPDIKAADAQADIVLVYPHWGREYQARPTGGQRAQARAWLRAGADVILGNHAHWTAGIEEIGDGLAFYALGNFVFDQAWSEQTMQGMLAELTFDGPTLRQVRLHPTLILDQAQPNLMDPAGDGKVVIQRVRDGSKGILDW